MSSRTVTVAALVATIIVIAYELIVQSNRQPPFPAITPTVSPSLISPTSSPSAGPTVTPS